LTSDTSLKTFVLAGMSGLEIDEGNLAFEEKVGSGITAVVYRGFLNGNIEVAIKEIEWNKTMLAEKQQQAFDREVGVMAKVSHPNLVRFFGVTSLSRPFRIITEFCQGGCCFELLHNEDDVVLQWAQQHKMCFDVARALEYLHTFSPKIIHRDLKSLNLLLHRAITKETDCPFVKVSDFGLSRMQDTTGDDEVWGKMTIAAGTCHWMAPEVFTGSNYDEMVDVYSYAMIMFEIICREIPFEEEEPANVGGLIIRGERPDLEAVPPDCPQEMRDLMIRSWAQDPKVRPEFREIVRTLSPLQSLWLSSWK